jgi:hypothetical protein
MCFTKIRNVCYFDIVHSVQYNVLLIIKNQQSSHTVYIYIYIYIYI